MGFITLAVTLTRYVDRADQVVTSSLYPAICAIRGQSRLLEELFVKSNRETNVVCIAAYLPSSKTTVVVFTTTGRHSPAGTHYAGAIFNAMGKILAPGAPPALPAGR